MDSSKTKTVRITVDGRIMRQMTLSSPVTLAEVWHLPEVVQLGPYRMAKLGPDGVAYVSTDSASFELWKKITDQSNLAAEASR